MRIAIVEDEPALANEVVVMLNELQQADICVFHSGEQFLFEYEAQPFDLILLDIQLQNMNGLETAKQLRKKDAHVAIVFLTNDASFVFEGYEVEAIRYWLKPVQKEKLSELLSTLSMSKPYLTWQINKDIFKIYEEDILYLESDGHYVICCCDQQILRKKDNFRKVCEQLSSDFFICHRSYCVNLNHVHACLKEDVLLDNQKLIPVSRTMKQELQQAFMRKCKEDLLCSF